MFDFGLASCLVAVATVLLVWLAIQKPRGIPPGPPLRLPMLGYLPFMKGNPLEAFQRLRSKYGDIFHVYLGSQLVIVLNGFDVIKDALVKHADAFSERQNGEGFEEILHSKGIIRSSGSVWKENRKFTVEVLREFGFGRNKLQDKILEEVHSYLSALKDEKEQPFDPHELTSTAVSNITCNIVFGHRFQYDDSDFRHYIEILDEIMKSFNLVKVIIMNSPLRKLPGDLTGYAALVKSFSTLREKLIEQSVEDHWTRFNPDQIDDFIDAFIKHWKEKETEATLSAIKEDGHLTRIIFDLFSAGTETTSSTIRFALMYLLHHPDIQERIHGEIRERIGLGRLPTLNDRSELPLLDAFIHEVQRTANIVPFSLPHSVADDVIFRGFLFPKNCTVIPNLDSVLKDPRVWKDPEVFRPERFLVDGKVVKPEEFIPFSMGRRVCLGESLARMELFLFLSAMLQHFRFECEENQRPPEIKGTFGVTYAPASFRLRAVPRLQ